MVDIQNQNKVIAEIKEYFKTYIYSQSKGEMYQSSDVYHALRFYI